MDGWFALHIGRTWKTSERWLASLVLLVAVLASAQQSQAQSTDTSRTSGTTDEQVSAQSRPGQSMQLTARIAELEREIDALRVAGRPKHFQRRRALGCAALVLGALAVVSGAMIGVYVASVHSEDSDSPPGSSNELSPGAKAVIGVPIGAGLVLIGGGIWALISLRKGNANQARIDALRETQRSLARERRVLVHGR